MSHKSLHLTAARESNRIHEWEDYASQTGHHILDREWWEAFLESVQYIAHECGVSRRRAKWILQMYLC